MSDHQIEVVLTALNTSNFRRSFALHHRELAYLQQKGMDIILAHAAEFIKLRLAPAQPLNDGKQTPYKGHPVFIAQHATATCCRSCLQKWHRFEKNRALSDVEQQYVVNVIRRWLQKHVHHHLVVQQSLL